MKTYRTTKRPTIKIEINGQIKTIVFTKNINAYDFRTSDKEIQEALEAHPLFNVLFCLCGGAEQAKTQQATTNNRNPISNIPNVPNTPNILQQTTNIQQENAGTLEADETEENNAIEKIAGIKTTQQAKAYLKKRNIPIANSANVETVIRLGLQNGIAFPELES
jgi:hypothetical protein